MRHDELATIDCSVSRASAILGERWVFRILQAAFLRARTFEDFQRGTGVARNVLTDRLRMLEDRGVLERRPYEAAGERVRYEYRLTPAGLELYPIIAALMDWGDRHTGLPDGPPTLLRHESCGCDTHAVVVCGCCGERLDPREVTPRPGPGAGPDHPLRRWARPGDEDRRAVAGRPAGGEHAAG